MGNVKAIVQGNTLNLSSVPEKGEAPDPRNLPFVIGHQLARRTFDSDW